MWKDDDLNVWGEYYNNKWVTFNKQSSKFTCKRAEIKDQSIKQESL